MMNLNNKPNTLHKLTVVSIHSHNFFFSLLSFFWMAIIYLFLLKIYAIIKKESIIASDVDLKFHLNIMVTAGVRAFGWHFVILWKNNVMYIIKFIT